MKPASKVIPTERETMPFPTSRGWGDKLGWQLAMVGRCMTSDFTPKRNKRGLRKPLPGWIKSAVMVRDGNACKKCRCGTGTVNGFEIHHRLPVSMGGNDHPSNLILLCGPCHGEWEKVGYLLGDFEAWMTWPQAAFALLVISRPWPTNITAEEFRQLMFSGCVPPAPRDGK